MSIKTFAAIDVGSFETQMKIYELSGKNKIREIDSVVKRIDLGSDTYATSKISIEKMEELTRALNEFKEIMNGYKVVSYKAYGTSAIREAENYVILKDQIEQSTGIDIEVLSNSEQRFLDYKSVAYQTEIFREIIAENTAIIDIGGGSIQLSLFENDTLVSTQNLRLGVLRINERLKSMNVGNKGSELVVEEMLSAQLNSYKKLYLKDRTIKNIIVIDDYVSPWSVKLAKQENRQPVRSVENLDEMLVMLKNNSQDHLAKIMGIPQDKVPLVVISAMIVKKITSLMDASKLWLPGSTLCDGMAYEYAEANKMLQGEHDFEKDITACALNISKRYMGSRKRSETLLDITGVLFDGTKKLHGLGKREKLYLQIAAILHDCGKYVSFVNMGENSYNIIMATEMIGLSHLERKIVANIVRFNHSKFDYYNTAQSENLDSKSYLIVAKLVAILRLANSLDRSHKHKMKSMKTSLADGELIITVDSQEDITLELGYFDASSEFFKEIYSVTPILKQKKKI